MTDTLISGGLVGTQDPQRRVIADGAVAIRGNRILEVGPRAEVAPRYPGAEVIDARGRIVCPWHGMEFEIRTGKFPGNLDMALEGVQVQVQDGDVFVIA